MNSLECNVGDPVDSSIAKYIGQRCWRMETSRDGASKLGLLDTVLSALWTGFVVLYAIRDLQSRPNEESMFFDKLEHSSWWPSVLRRLEEDQVLMQQGDELEARYCELSASIFWPESKNFL